MEVGGEACGKKTKIQGWANSCLRADSLQAFIPNRHLPSGLLTLLLLEREEERHV